MRQLQKIFLQGLFAFIPIAVTAYLLVSVVRLIDDLFGKYLQSILPVYIPGLGLMTSIIVIFIFGLLLNNFITKNILMQGQKRLNQIPFIKAIYSPLSDLMNLFSQGGENSAMKSVVFVRIGANGARAMGLVTRDHFDESEDLKTKAAGCVSVYIPMSYGLGGFTLLVPKDQVEPVDIPIEKAMSLAITGWVKAEKKDESKL